MADLEQEVLVKKVKIAEDGAHGGAWKVAYADFVTAMMAFFLLLWLLNATEQEVLDGVSSYFTPTIRTLSSDSGSGNVFGGATPNDPGPTQDKETQSPDINQGSSRGELNSNEEETGAEREKNTGSDGPVDSEEEEKLLIQAKLNLETQLESLPPELKQLEETIKVDVTDEGLRIQLVDNNSHPHFEPSSDVLTDHAKISLRLLTDIAINLPNPITLTGHTTPDESQDIGGWELSVDRANAIRRGLHRNGMPELRFDTVIGVGDSDPQIPENPNSSQNRRMTIVLLRRAPPP